MSERQTMEADIVCVGFGPATAGFLTTLSKMPDLESRCAPGMPLQVICYERADDIGFGVSGVVTRARGIRTSLPDLDLSRIPMATPVTREKLVYLRKGSAWELPYIPPFLHKGDGILMSLGQFLQYVGGQLMGSGAVQIWPGTPVEEAIVEEECVRGVRLQDVDVLAGLTVVGDGPVGIVGRQLNARSRVGQASTPARDVHVPPVPDLEVRRRPGGLPHEGAVDEWAVGMKMVIDLPRSDLAVGTVLHTFGYPEPEIFGFFYVHPGNVASAGIFVPSWFHAPTQTAYQYLQRFLLHPYLWRHVNGGRMRSWGAKSLNESGRRAEPVLAGDGYARIGEGSGSTNILTGSGVDEAWTTGTQLAEAVVQLLRTGRPFTRENLEDTYVSRRAASSIDAGARVAEHSRDGFHHGMIPGLIGMGLAGFTKGRFYIPGTPRRMSDARARSNHWPDIPYDGQLLVSHQDALLMGGKVQAPPGFPDHVRFLEPTLCETCASKRCIQMCSGQAITAGDGAVPAFDREKCVYCGACLWNCVRGAIAFRTGAGGLHSNEN